MRIAVWAVTTLVGVLGVVPPVQAAKEADARIVSVDLKNDRDSTGRKIKKIITVTEQTKVPMWGTLAVHVLVKDKDGHLFFGRNSFRQTRRSGNDQKSVDRWESHIIIEKMNSPSVVGYYITYSNNDNGKVLDAKAKNVRAPEAWLKENQDKTPITIESESHTVLN